MKTTETKQTTNGLLRKALLAGFLVIFSAHCSGQTFDTLLNPETAASEDKTPPSISSASSSSGTVGAGSDLTVTVDFDEAVIVNTSGGTPTITLDDGTVLTYSSGSGSNQLTFTYTVQDGDNFTLDNSQALTIDTNGGSITDANGNAATDLTADAPTSVSSVTVDGVTPSISGAGMASGTPTTIGNGQTVQVDVTLDEAVTIDGTAKVDMDTDNDGTPDTELTCTQSSAPSSTLNCSYTVQSGDNFTIGSTTKPGLALDLSDGGTVTDAGGNSISDGSSISWSSGEPSADISVDGNIASITSISSSPASGDFKVGDDIQISLTYSSAVDLTGTDPNDDLVITLSNGKTLTVNGPIGTTGNNSDGSTTLTGTYTIGSGDDVTGLTVSSIALDSGASLTTDSSGGSTNASLLLPVGSNLSGINVDTNTPSAPTLTSASFDSSDDTGSSDSDQITKQNTNLTFEAPAGAVEPGATVKVYDGTPTLLGTATANSDGSFSLTTDTNAPDGTHTFAFTQTDAAGNESLTQSFGSSITIDTSTATPSSIDLASANDSGSSNSDNITNNTSLTLSGTAEEGSSVVIYSDSSKTTQLGTATSDGSGNWSTTISLSDGTTTPYVEVTDTAGNTANASGPAITVDTSAPATPSSASLATADQGTNDQNTSDNITNVASGLTYSGTAEAGTTIEIFADGASQGTTTADGSGNWSYDISLAEGGPYNITVTATDTASNTSSTSSATQLTIDQTAPKLTGLTSTTSDGSYTTSKDINITGNFDEAVYLSGGNLNITLETGGTDRVVSITAGSYPATSLAGTYTVQSGDTSSDLTANGVALSAGVLVDAAGNAATLSIPASSNIADSKALVIDTTQPFIANITSSTADGTYGIGQDVNISVEFNEGVTLSGGTLDVTLETGTTDRTVSISAGSYPATTLNGTYTVQSGDTSSDLNVSSMALGSGASLQDAVGLSADLSVPGSSNLANNKAIVIDTSGTSVTSITSSTTDGTYGPGEPVNVSVNFSESVTLEAGETLRVTLSNGQNVDITGATSGSTLSGTYTVGATGSSHDSSDLDATAISMTSGTLQTTSGSNTVTPSLPSTTIADGSAIVIDTTAPALSSLNSSTAAGTYGVGKDINITANFNESVSISGGNLEVTLETGTTDRVVNITGSGTSVSGTYTVQSGDTSSDLTANSLAAGSGATIEDAAGNDATLTIPSGQNLADNETLVLDTVVPTISSSSLTSDNISFSVNFSEAVYSADNATGALETSDFGITFNQNSGNATGASITGITHSAGATTATLTLSITGTPSGVETVVIAPASNSSIYDVGGNNVATSETETQTLNDKLAPTFTSLSLINDAADNYINNSERSNTTDLAGSLSASGHTYSYYKLTTSATACDGSLTYGSDGVIPDSNSSDFGSDGSYKICVKLADNVGNITYGSSGNLTLDTAAPDAPTALDLATDDDTGDSNSDNITNKTTALTISGSSAENISIEVFEGATSKCTTTASSNSFNCDISLANNASAYSITAKATDAAGNESVASSALSITVDTTDPSVNSITSTTGDGTYFIGNNINVTVTFNESVTLASGTLDVTLETGTADDDISVTGTYPTSTLTGTYTVGSGDESTDLDSTAIALNSGSISDVAGNTITSVSLPGTTIANGSAIVLDTAVPSITSITGSPTTGSFKQGDTIDITINFSENVDLSSGDSGAADLTITLNTGETVTITGALTNRGSLTGTYTIGSGINVSELNVSSIALSDNAALVDNATTSKNVSLTLPSGQNLADQTGTIVVDNTSPTISSSTLASDNSSIDVTFSEGLYSTSSTSGALDSSDFTISFTQNGGNVITVNIASVTHTAGNTTATLNLSHSTTATGVEQITVKPAATAIYDAAGNDSATTESTTKTLNDTTAPTKPGIPDLASVDDTGSSNSDNLTKLTSGLTLSGTVEAGANVEIFRAGSTSLGTVTADGTTGAYSIDISLAAGTHSITVKATDSANNTSAASDALSIEVDTTNPLISGVGSDTADGTYKTGTTIDIDVNFNESVFVTTSGGTPTIKLFTGTSQTTDVGYSSVSGSTVTFNYTVASGDESSDLAYDSSGALALNNGLIQDTAGNSATLTLPSPGNTNSLSANKALVIDGKVPTVTNVSADAGYNTAHKAGDTVQIKITFSEAVTVDDSGGVPTLALETGSTDRNATYLSGSTTSTLVFSYTVQNGDVSGDLSYKSSSSLSINTGTSIKDSAGNDATLTLATPGAAGSLSANNSIVIDTAQPTISSISSTSSADTYGIGADINITVTMSEAVTLATGPLNVTLETGTTDRVVSVSAGSYPATTLTGTYTVQSGDASTDLNANSVALGGGSLTDAAGNSADLALPSGQNLADNEAIAIDTTTASITSITSTTGDGTYGPGSDVNITVSFSDDVTLSGASTGLTVTLDNGQSVTIGDFTGTSASATYTVGATGSSQDSSDLDATAITLTDGTLETTTGSNPVTVSLPTTTIADGSAIVVDTTAPVINNITSTTASGTYGTGSDVNITVNFSEAVTISGTGPSLRATLNTSDVVSYTSISGVSSVSGTYTVSSGDSASPLDVNTPLTLAGTSPALKDAAGNDAVLTIGSGDNLSDSKTINISTTSTTVQFTSTSSNALENITSVSLPLELSASTGSDVTVSYTVSGTSTSGTDHNLSNGDATISAGNTTGSIAVTVTNDALDEVDETLVVTLSSVTTGNASVGTNTTYTYTINDDDDPPQVAFANATSATLDESAATHSITVSLSTASGKDVTVPFSVNGSSSATASSDYDTLSSSPVTITAGSTSTTISFNVLSDTTDEVTGETVILDMGSPTNATQGATTTHTATITDDDGTPTISILDATLAAEGDSGTSTLTVTINMVGTSGSLVSVDYATVNGTAVAGTCGSGIDYQSASGTMNWTATTSGSKSFSVTVCGDTLAEQNETILATLSNVVGSATINDGSATLTATNDDTPLTISSAETLDCDPVDGILDHYKVTFSTAITDSTFGGYQADSEGLSNAAWSVKSHSNIRLDHGSAVATACHGGAGDTANDTVAYLKFDQGASANTGLLPELTATASTVEAADGTGKLYYNTGSVTSTDVTETDGAGPVVIYALASEGDSSGSGTYEENGVGRDDTLELRYSETMNAPDLSGTHLDTILSFDNSHTLGEAVDIASATWGTSIYSNDTLTITFGTFNSSDDPDIYDGDAVTAIGTTVKDANGNNPASSVATPTTILPTFDSGAKGPSIVSAEYLDTDSNGFIDHIKIVLSKTVNDTTFPGYNATAGTNGVHDVTTVWQIAGYSGVRLDTSDSLDTGDNDDTIYLKFNEGSDYDTAAKPDLTATLGSAGLRDAIDNCYINTTPTDCLTAGSAVVRTTDVAETDAAPAIMTYSSARVGDRYIFLKFSEGVYGSTGTPACGSGGELKSADFSYGNNTGGGATSVQGVDTSASCAANNPYARLFTDAVFESGDIDSDSIAAASSQVYDAADNAMGITANIIRATVAPYLVKASSYYSSGKYYFRLVFSEAMDFTTATNASNYTLSEDVATACGDIASIPLSVNAISSTIFDLETGTQCGVGDVNETTYRIVASSNILDENEIEGITNPDTATTVGTSATDQTPPGLIQALSLSSTTVQLTYSEPMKTGDRAGSATCASTYATGATCTEDVYTAGGGTELKYSITPGLGTISSVLATANPSVFIVTHNDVQSGSFYNAAAYVENTVADIPEDLSGNDLDAVPNNQATFKGRGSAIDDLTDGSLFDDPFADGSTFAYAFSYKDKVYLGPNDQNSGAFRFEPDASNPITVNFWATGSSCTNGTGTFGTSAQSTCDVDLGPNGERGLVGFNSGVVSVSSSDYELLMVGPLKNGVGHTYFSQDIDTQLDFTACSFSATGGGNSKSVQTAFAYGDSYYAGLSTDHGQQAPILIRQQLTDTNSDGVLECGTATDLSVRSVTDFGKGSGDFKNAAAIIGVDTMYFSPSGSGYFTNDAFLAANAGSVQRWDLGTNPEINSTTSNWNMLYDWTADADDTLVLPSLEKIRPGEKGVPFIVEYKGALYMARNITSGGLTGTTPSGGYLYKCTSGCETSGNWSKLFNITAFDTDNRAISMLIVNGDYLYLGTDNTTDGVGVYRASTSVTGTGSFTQQGPSGSEYGLGLGASVAPYIFSSASQDKQGTNYLYITVGPSTDAIKVVTQHD